MLIGKENNVSETGNHEKISKFVFKLASKFDGIPNEKKYKLPENSDLMNIKSSNVRQENPPFHNPNNIIFEIPQAIDTILLMNNNENFGKKDNIIKSSKHVELSISKNAEPTLKSISNTQNYNRFKMNIKKLRQKQYDRSQNKDQLQNPPEVTGIHKVSSQSDLINKNSENKREMMNDLISKSNRMMKVNKEDFKINIVENIRLNELDLDEVRMRGHKKTLSMPHDLYFPPRALPFNSIDKNKINSFKHPLITINKPSKEEIEQSKERQRRRNLSQHLEDECEQQYNDVGMNNIGLNINFNIKNLNSIFSSNRFFTKRSMIYNTYLNEGINCNNIPRCELTIPNSRNKLQNVHNK